VDVAPLRSTQAAGSAEVARQIEAACREHGFFYITGHGVAPDLLARLTRACTAFFALPQAAKLEIAMARGGPAWRGYFPVGAELTSGRPDLKEGLYFGAELGGDDPRVRAGLPLHGPNLFPRQVPELRGGSRSGRHADGGQPRWDGQNLQAFRGTYGDYLLGKVSKVFPQLRPVVLTDEAP
jgi:isopenicillin N synthase-like dioxygenase